MFSAVRRVLAVLGGLLLLAGAVACTGGSEPDRSAGESSTAPSTAPSSAPRSVPLHVEVTHVAGRLRAKQRTQLSHQVGRTISAYVDAAFLRGESPRSDFGDSFAAFTSGAARRARSDRALLTNQPLGTSTESVRAARRTAYLSVLAPGGTVAGVTAAVDLVLVVGRGDEAARKIHLKGRLLLTRNGRGGWAIFGYDVNRSDTPARKAGS